MRQFHRGLQKRSLLIFCFQCERKCCVAALCAIHRHTLSTILILLPNAASCVVPSSQHPPPPTPPQKQRKTLFFIYAVIVRFNVAVIVYCIVQVSQVILRSKFLAVNHLKGKTVSQVYLALVVCREIILELRIPTSTVSLQM